MSYDPFSHEREEVRKAQRKVEDARLDLRDAELQLEVARLDLERKEHEKEMNP